MKAQAQASARVDVPTARGPRSPTRVQVSVANAWICAPLSTDLDPQSFKVNA